MPEAAGADRLQDDEQGTCRALPHGGSTGAHPRQLPGSRARGDGSAAARRRSPSQPIVPSQPPQPASSIVPPPPPTPAWQQPTWQQASGQQRPPLPQGVEPHADAALRSRSGRAVELSAGTSAAAVAVRGAAAQRQYQPAIHAAYTQRPLRQEVPSPLDMVTILLAILAFFSVACLIPLYIAVFQARLG